VSLSYPQQNKLAARVRDFVSSLCSAPGSFVKQTAGAGEDWIEVMDSPRFHAGTQLCSTQYLSGFAEANNNTVER